jgi:GNAT superfamily N-acetyltransferase
MVDARRSVRLPALELRAVRFEEVAEVLRLVGRAVAHGCRGHYDEGQQAAVRASYESTLFVDSLGPVESIAAVSGDRDDQDDQLVRGVRIVGFAQLDRASARLRALFVDASCQGRGVGRALLEDAEARARAFGCRRLHGAMSLNAVPFYERAGYRPCAGPERLSTTGVAVPIVRMEKVFSRASP